MGGSNGEADLVSTEGQSCQLLGLLKEEMSLSIMEGVQEKVDRI